MNLCDDGHDEVCYEVRLCPVCIKEKERQDIEDKLDAAHSKIDDLQTQLDEAKSE